MSNRVEESLVTGSPLPGEPGLGLEPVRTGGRPPELGVWQLAWPSMAMFALHSLVGMVDFVFVASLGTDAVAAVGMAHQIHFFVFAALGAVTRARWPSWPGSGEPTIGRRWVRSPALRCC